MTEQYQWCCVCKWNGAVARLVGEIPTGEESEDVRLEVDAAEREVGGRVLQMPVDGDSRGDVGGA